jgi:PucR C-terminal helix-turn-helix domain
MTSSVDSEAWRAVPAQVAGVIEPELEGVTAEILATIAREVPAYARPLEGSFGRGIRTGVAEALRQFVSLIRDPEAGRGPGRDVYVGLGRGEFRQGRTLDSLQAAYRLGARVAWRRFAAAARRARLDAEALSLLAEAIFAYIDELSADSVEGYAEARAEVEDERRRRRRELAALLTREPPADPADVRAAAQAAAWQLPGRAAALACRESDLAVLARRLPVECLAAPLGELGCILLRDPEGPGRAAALKRAARSAPLALGSAGPPADLPQSWSLARTALAASEAGMLPAVGAFRAEDHLGELLLFEGRGLAAMIAARRLAAFDDLTERARARMRETALAFLRHHGNSVAMARALNIHPQTARYRMARLRELLADQLDDPDARFELEIALRRLDR